MPPSVLARQLPKRLSKRPVLWAASRPTPLVCFEQKKELPPQKILKCGFICLRWMRRFRIGPRKKNARRDGYHVRLLPESFVSRYSRIFVAALRRVKSAPVCRRRALFRGERTRPKHS